MSNQVNTICDASSTTTATASGPRVVSLRSVTLKKSTTTPRLLKLAPTGTPTNRGMSLPFVSTNKSQLHSSNSAKTNNATTVTNAIWNDSDNEENKSYHSLLLLCTSYHAFSITRNSPRRNQSHTQLCTLRGGMLSTPSL